MGTRAKSHPTKYDYHTLSLENHLVAARSQAGKTPTKNRLQMVDGGSFSRCYHAEKPTFPHFATHYGTSHSPSTRQLLDTLRYLGSRDLAGWTCGGIVRLLKCAVCPRVAQSAIRGWWGGGGAKMEVSGKLINRILCIHSSHGWSACPQRGIHIVQLCGRRRRGEL